MPTVISDSSTLIHLTAIGKLDLLRKFYNKIILPTAVWREVVIEGEIDQAQVKFNKHMREAGLKFLSQTIKPCFAS